MLSTYFSSIRWRMMKIFEPTHELAGALHLNIIQHYLSPPALHMHLTFPRTLSCVSEWNWMTMDCMVWQPQNESNCRLVTARNSNMHTQRRRKKEEYSSKWRKKFKTLPCQRRFFSSFTNLTPSLKKKCDHQQSRTTKKKKSFLSSDSHASVFWNDPRCTNSLAKRGKRNGWNFSNYPLKNKIKHLVQYLPGSVDFFFSCQTPFQHSICVPHIALSLLNKKNDNTHFLCFWVNFFHSRPRCSLLCNEKKNRISVHINVVQITCANIYVDRGNWMKKNIYKKS